MPGDFSDSEPFESPENESKFRRQLEIHQEELRIAIKVWLDLLERHPKDPTIWMRLGHTYLQLHELHQAAAAFFISHFFDPHGKGSKYTNMIRESIATARYSSNQEFESPIHTEEILKGVKQFAEQFKISEMDKNGDLLPQLIDRTYF
jgi:hypothetical protein